MPSRMPVLFAWIIAMTVLLHASVLLIGCLSDKAKSTEPPATCAKAGDSCTFSPGKLGLCIEAAGSRAALLCQSQH